MFFAKDFPSTWHQHPFFLPLAISIGRWCLNHCIVILHDHCEQMYVTWWLKYKMILAPCLRSASNHHQHWWSRGDIFYRNKPSIDNDLSSVWDGLVISHCFLQSVNTMLGVALIFRDCRTKAYSDVLPKLHPAFSSDYISDSTKNIWCFTGNKKCMVPAWKGLESELSI